ncbi:hypothetical protein MYX75_07910 [Acidobacteria bacterium AH-259-A15]|nr:hypothetical protein [Acidobacteria bacterium AH-259-A15]
MPDYVQFLKKSDKELVKEFTGADPGTPYAEKVKIILEVKNARRMARLTWWIAAMAVIQGVDTGGYLEGKHR